MTISTAFWLVLASSIVCLLYAFLRTLWIHKQENGTKKLQEISGYVADGAMSFLKQEYRVLVPFVAIVAILLFLVNSGFGRWQAFSFLLGSFTSGLAGFIGMKVATASNKKTTAAAVKSTNSALKIAFSGGSVMGLSVVGLSLLGFFILFIIFSSILNVNVETITQYFLPVITGFSLGASAIALFARVGGGIFTKAADVGADLVGKVEAGIPEDDQRNPATIADNVGDNVGDVAGMGADLFESFVGSIIGSLILAFAVEGSGELKLRLAAIPLVMVSLGAIASIIGIYFVRLKNENDSPQRALNVGAFVAALIVVAALYPIINLILGTYVADSPVQVYEIFLAAVIGLVAGISIGLITEHYTGFGKKPVREIVKASETGSATNIITGIGVGMFSTMLPIIVIAFAVGLSFLFAGIFGIAIAALGMLVTLGIQLSVDAYGPIADNAGGLAVMSEYPDEVRNRTDALDAVGNTTAAIGKGFAIGSAALTTFILFSSFKVAAGIQSVDLTSIPVLIGLLIGAVIPYIFSSLAIGAIGRAAFKMIEEVRRQFREKPGILEYKDKPDYNKCINISTVAAIREMLIPGLGAVIIPIVVGFVGGVTMLTGVIVGTTVSGIVLALFMSNSGGAWDNAKKMIEAGELGGKGSDAHKASVVGDTVGDPFKDTAGPSLNILIKLMTVIALVIAPLL